jgi:hypothetical protein
VGPLSVSSTDVSRTRRGASRHQHEICRGEAGLRAHVGRELGAAQCCPGAAASASSGSRFALLTHALLEVNRANRLCAGGSASGLLLPASSAASWPDAGRPNAPWSNASWFRLSAGNAPRIDAAWPYGTSEPESDASYAWFAAVASHPAAACGPGPARLSCARAAWPASARRTAAVRATRAIHHQPTNVLQRQRTRRPSAHRLVSFAARSAPCCRPAVSAGTSAPAASESLHDAVAGTSWARSGTGTWVLPWRAGRGAGGP